MCEHKQGVEQSQAATEAKTDARSDKDGSGIFHSSIAGGGSREGSVLCWHSCLLLKSITLQL